MSVDRSRRPREATVNTVRSTRAAASNARQRVHDVTRSLLLLAVVRPAARHLPRSWALATARLSGRIVASYTLGGSSPSRDAAATFSLDQKAARRLARAWAEIRFTDFVVLERIRRRREDPAAWRVEERNTEVIDKLRDSGASFVVAAGHFLRHPSYTVWTGRAFPQRTASVVAPLGGTPSGLRSRWMHEHLALMTDILEAEDADIVIVGRPGVARVLVDRLKQPGTVVVIAPDAPLPPGQAGHERAFAGRRARAFATGTARIARLAGCPIIVCNPYLDEDGTVVLEWVGLPLTPDEDVDDDQVIDAILDVVESTIGRRPDQYVLPIGAERRWDPTRERWYDPAVALAPSVETEVATRANS